MIVIVAVVVAVVVVVVVVGVVGGVGGELVGGVVGSVVVVVAVAETVVVAAVVVAAVPKTPQFSSPQNYPSVVVVVVDLAGKKKYRNQHHIGKMKIPAEDNWTVSLGTRGVVVVGGIYVVFVADWRENWGKGTLVVVVVVVGSLVGVVVGVVVAGVADIGGIVSIVAGGRVVGGVVVVVVVVVGGGGGIVGVGYCLG